MSSEPEDAQTDGLSEATDSEKWGFKSTKPAPPLSTDKTLELTRGVKPAPPLKEQSVQGEVGGASLGQNEFSDLAHRRPQKEPSEPQEAGSE